MNNQVLVDHDCIGYDVVGLYHWNQLKMLCFFNEIGSIFRYMLGKIEILPAAGEFFWIFQLLNLIFFEIFKPPWIFPVPPWAQVPPESLNLGQPPTYLLRAEIVNPPFSQGGDEAMINTTMSARFSFVILRLFNSCSTDKSSILLHFSLPETFSVKFPNFSSSSYRVETEKSIQCIMYTVYSRATQWSQFKPLLLIRELITRYKSFTD